MVEKACSLILSALVTIGILGGCEIDVNEIVSNISQEESSSDAFYESSVSEENTDTDTDVDVLDTDTQTDSEEPEVSQLSFDTSAYKTMFVSGASAVEVFEDAKGSGAVVGVLTYGDSVSFIKSVVADKNDAENSMSFIYSETMGSFGYVKTANLVDLYDEVTYGQIYYISSDNAAFYADQSCTAVYGNLSKNDMVTVLAKLATGVWRVSNKSGTIGYIGSSFLSEEKIEKKTTSSKSDKKTSSKATSSQVESKAESRVESKVESQIESQVESLPESIAESKSESQTSSTTSSKKEPSAYTGVGDPPSSYTLYTVDVDIGYLALRSDESDDPDSIIGELYYGEYVDVIDLSGAYWYVYSPSKGMYGFISGNSDYLVYADY